MTVRAIGMVIYTYSELEDKLDHLWEWTEAIARWAEKEYAEYHFSSRSKESRRIYKVTRKNLDNLYGRLRTDAPWYQVNFGVPDGTIIHSASTTEGVNVTWFSSPQFGHGAESIRQPSYVCIIAAPDHFRSAEKVSKFVDLGVKAWSIVQGVYGYIDIETVTLLKKAVLYQANSDI